LFETYQTDLTCNLEEFKREIALWRTRWSITPRDQMPTSLCARRSTLNDRSAVALVTGTVNMIHKMVSIEWYSTGFTAQSEVRIWSRGVILQRVRHRAISLINAYPSRFQCGFRQSYGEVRVC
jgi:hypothetical protein